MREFKLTESKESKLKTYTVVVDGENGDFDCQPVYGTATKNDFSFMNIYFTVDENGKVVDVSVKVNDL